jgi:hypothetical protein
VISIVSELGLNRSYYRITQVTGKSFPDSISHQSQSIRLNGLFGGLFIRIRLGQRGDYLGNCIDLGIMAQTQILNQLITRDLTNSTHPSTFNVEKTTISKLADINPVNYKAAIRLGLDRVSLIASYQLSRLLSRSAGKDLPGLEIGIEISPVRY